MKRIIRVTAAVMIGVLTCMSVYAFAADQRAIYGILVSYKNHTLTVMNKQGSREQFDVNKNTLVSSNEGTAILEKLLPGTRLSITAKGDKAVIISIKEVPK